MTVGPDPSRNFPSDYFRMPVVTARPAGTTVLGAPVGTVEYVHAQARKRLGRSIEQMRQLSLIGDFQAIRRPCLCCASGSRPAHASSLPRWMHP